MDFIEPPMATSALEYGARSASHAKVDVRRDAGKQQGRPWLVLDWIEELARAESCGRQAARRRECARQVIRNCLKTLVEREGLEPSTPAL
jgi:hypothetical protein